MAHFNENFSIANWNITTVEEDTTTGNAKTYFDLIQDQNQYFYEASDGYFVFRAPVDGATTKNSSYTRSELRELNDDGSRASWTLQEGGTMTATLRVDEVPILANGDGGRFIIGQVHGGNDELVRIYYDDGQVYFRNEIAIESGVEETFHFHNSAGDRPEVSIGEEFSYLIDVQGNDLVVKIFADGMEYVSTTKIHDAWQDNEFYFKAGVYNGVSSNPTAWTYGDGASQVSFKAIDIGHAEGEGLDAYPNIVHSNQGAETFIGTQDLDVFVFDTVIDSTESSRDRIIDFDASVDKIDVSALGFAELRTDGFKTEEDQLRLAYSSATDRTYIRSDKSDFELYLQGDYRDTLTADNFVFDTPQIVLGKEGAQDLFANSGESVFVYDAVDQSTVRGRDGITNFEVGIDKIDLSALGFKGLDTDGGKTEEHELRLAYSSGSDRTYIRSDQSDFELYLNGDYRDKLTNSDFILDIPNEINATQQREKLHATDKEDIFVFSKTQFSTDRASDGIFGFDVGVDLVDLSSLGFAGFDTDGGRTESDEFRLTYSSNSDRTYLRSDQSDFEIYFKGNYTTQLSESDFIF